MSDDRLYEQGVCSARVDGLRAAGGAQDAHNTPH